MNAQDFITLLENPEKLTARDTDELRDITEEFPYFQAAHALRLKGLKNQDSFRYNTVLKKTAVRTTDRTVLFNYITSETFDQNTVSSQIKNQEIRLKNVSVHEAIDLSAVLEQGERDKADRILDPSLFVKKEDSLITPKNPKEILSVGKPLEFTNKEEHSFTEWLSISSLKPIDRTEKKALPKEVQGAPPTNRKNYDTSQLSTSDKPSKGHEENRKRKQQIIDSFIESNPKIEINQTSKKDYKSLIKRPIISQESLMTETLARVYIEQKNFKKAKQAFRILSLKYPEKSGFFADQIRAVEQLEENKD